MGGGKTGRKDGESGVKFFVTITKTATIWANENFFNIIQIRRAPNKKALMDFESQKPCGVSVRRFKGVDMPVFTGA